MRRMQRLFFFFFFFFFFESIRLFPEGREGCSGVTSAVA